MNDAITRNFSEIQSGLRGLSEIQLADFAQIALLALAVIVGVYLLLKIAGKIIKIVVVVGILLVIGFVLFGFDPMGIGSHIMFLWRQLISRGG